MAYIYKLDNNWVSSALLPLETIFTSSRITVSDSAVNIFGDDDIALGLNIGSRRIAYKHNDIVFKTDSKRNGDNKITYVTRPSIERGFVQWKGTFSAAGVISNLLGIDLSSTEDSIELTIDASAKTLTSTGAAEFVITWTDTSLSIDGSVVSGDITRDYGTVTAIFHTEELLLRLNADFTSIDTIHYATPETPYDLSYSSINGDAGIYEEIEIVLDKNDIHVDDYAHQYFKIPNYNAFVSKDAIWLPDERYEYLKSDQFAFIMDSHSESEGFSEFNKDRLRSAVNTPDSYEDGLISCSVKTYIGYVKVYSSYVYIDYYYIKVDTSEDECVTVAQTVSYGRACRLKITSSKITMTNVDSSLDHVTLMPNANSQANEVFDKMRFGAGSFKSNYKMYTYRDKRDYIEVIFNRESSSKYVKIKVEDQSTRYYATITEKNGTSESVSTKTFSRSSATPVWSIAQTGKINIILKKALDNASDTVETLFTNSAVTLEPDTIKILTRTLYVNILEQVVAFPQQKLTFDTLAVVAWPDSAGVIENLQINFQPATGAIYARVPQGSAYDYYTKDELVGMLNSISDSYVFDITCNISSLRYVDLDGNSHVYPFTNSTIIIGEKVNGPDGIFYRVYYKNADSYGFITANTYEIEE
jgi:hypothetical protein